MNCYKAKKLVIMYLDGELAEKDREELLMHISTCVNCREEMEFISKIRENLPIPETLEPSPYSLSRIKAKIKSEEKEAIFLPFGKRLSPATVGVYLIIILLPFLTAVFLGDVYMKQVGGFQLSSAEKIKAVFNFGVLEDSPLNLLDDACKKITGGA